MYYCSTEQKNGIAVSCAGYSTPPRVVPMGGGVDPLVCLCPRTCIKHSYAKPANIGPSQC